MLKKLQDDLIDVLIIFEMELEQNSFNASCLFKTTICLIVPTSSLLARTKKIKMAEIENYKSIIQNQGFSTWSVFQ